MSEQSNFQVFFLPYICSLFIIDMVRYICKVMYISIYAFFMICPVLNYINSFSNFQCLEEKEKRTFFLLDVTILPRNE